MTTANRVMMTFAIVCGVMLSMFVLLWVVIGDARIAATIVASVTITLLLITVGWAMSHMSHMQAKERKQPDVITGEARQIVPQLPEARWIPTDTGYTRSDTLDTKAMHIGQLLRDRRLQPTRANIKAVGMEHGVNGNEAASMIYRRFVEWEWCEAVAQGQQGRWKDE